MGSFKNHLWSIELWVFGDTFSVIASAYNEIIDLKRIIAEWGKGGDLHTAQCMICDFAKEVRFSTYPVEGEDIYHNYVQIAPDGYEKNEYMVYTYALGSDFATPKKLLKGNYPYLTQEDRTVLEEFVAGNKRCGHACFAETGWMYGTYPELVRLDKMDAESGESTQRFKGFAKNGC